MKRLKYSWRYQALSWVMILTMLAGLMPMGSLSVYAESPNNTEQIQTEPVQSDSSEASEEIVFDNDENQIMDSEDLLAEENEAQTEEVEMLEEVQTERDLATEFASQSEETSDEENSTEVENPYESKDEEVSEFESVISMDPETTDADGSEPETILENSEINSSAAIIENETETVVEETSDVSVEESKLVPQNPLELLQSVVDEANPDILEEVSLFAEPTEKSLLQYTVSGTTVTITGCDDSVVDLVLPESIDGATVTAISASAFSGHANLKTVAVPNSVTSVKPPFFGATEYVVSRCNHMSSFLTTHS